MAKTWDFEIRQTGKAALAKIAKNEEVDTIDLKYALRELNEQYTEPPLHGSSLGAEFRCTSNGWIASFGGSGYGVREIITQCSSAEEALQALVKEFDRWRGHTAQAGRTGSTMSCSGARRLSRRLLRAV